jgi:hypothetical protein
MAGVGQGGFDSDAGTKVGIEIWRIENMNPVRIAKEEYGQFFKGDAYIVLKTEQKNSSLVWNLHFWLGAECSQDEYGSAALRTVELDDQLGGGPVQYREVQDHESPHFLAMFKGGLQLKSGGIASAFKKVDRDSYETRLFHLKGKRNVRCNQVEVKAASMNEGDVFILDVGLKMYQWNGKDANKYEKFKALEMLNKINAEERGGKAETIFMDSGKDDEKVSEFWAALGSKGDVKSAEEGGSDAAPKKDKPKLFKISDASGSLECKQVADGNLEYTMLDENDCFLVDSGSEITVWIGKKASKDERRNGMKYAADYMKDNNKPNWTPCNRVPGGGEPPAFKALFKGWPVPGANAKAGTPAEKKEADTSQLYQKNKAEEEKMYVLDGKVEVFRVNNFKREKMPEDLNGQFWAGDSFVILYTYKQGSKDAWLIYFWQGRDSSIDEKGASALIAKEMDDELGGDPVQVRVVQGKEPKHFLSLFQGKMIVHEGGVASGFKNQKAVDTFDTDGISLFHIKGTNAHNTRGVQVAEVAASLNSGDCFVLLTPETVFEWYGEGANADEKSACKSIAQVIRAGATTEVAEGSENDAFWAALGGKGEYPKIPEGAAQEHDPRLFRMTCNVGHFLVEEIFDFVQDDLIYDDVMMLDVFSEVYVWVGGDASRNEKDLALTTAMDYIKNAPDGRDAATPVFRISAGYEPPNFTQWFLGWDASKAQSAGEDPYLLALKAKGVEVGSNGLAQVSESMVGYAKPSDASYTLEQLKAGECDNVDPANKELYLSDADFQTHLGTDKASWAKFAKWKKQGAKKKLGIF